MNASWGFVHFFTGLDLVGQVVLWILLTASVGSWFLMAKKTVQLFSIQRNNQLFLHTFEKNHVTLDFSKPFVVSQSTWAHMVEAGVLILAQLKHTQVKPIDERLREEILRKRLHQVYKQHQSRLEMGQTYLATVASSAPFVGLLGTVWGIYHALVMISVSGQGTLDKVAGPVGESLIMTGIGLAVAIPAAVAYNTFVRLVKNMLVQTQLFLDEVTYFLLYGVKMNLQSAKTNQMHGEVS